MEPPCWCTSVEHQHGGRKIVLASGIYFGYLGDSLSALNKKGMYISAFPNTLTSEERENYDLRRCFSTNALAPLCHAPP